MRQLFKRQGQNFDLAVENKTWFYNFYYTFFIKLITNYYEYKGLPESIDKLYLEKNLCEHGFVGAWEDENFGLIVSRGTLQGGFDIYDNPLKFQPINNTGKINFKAIPINWYNDNLDKNKAVIISNNNFNSSSMQWLHGFCSKLADIEQTIQINRNAQKTPYAILTDQNSLFSMKNLTTKVINGDPVIYLNTRKDKSGAIEPLQWDDMVHTLDLKADYLLDKLHDEKQRVINQILTMIGINNNAVDKAERLVAAEATANNGLIKACVNVNLNARKESFKRFNLCFGTNVEVFPSEEISYYNVEKVETDINTSLSENLAEEGEA